MDHIAIMNKSWGFIPRILRKEKIIESRWSKHRIAPWDKVHEGDVIYFRNSGEPVTAMATVTQVNQFKLEDDASIQELLNKYWQQIGFASALIPEHLYGKHYCILMWIEDPKLLQTPVAINKAGYGSAAAWMCVGDINSVMI